MIFRRKEREIESGKSDSLLDGIIQDELQELTAQSGGDRREISRADNEVKEAVSKATRNDIRDIMLIDKGRCPVCHSRTEIFLFTVVCPSCGWYKREVPDKGTSTVYLKNGEEIRCDYVHRGGNDEYLCIDDGVVIAQIMKGSVEKILHTWNPEDLESAKSTAKRLKEGICAWCNEAITSEDDEIFEDYVSFGSFQDHFTFCSEKHQKEFRKMYPSRIHRNCYETECNQCDLCIKRYDTHGFKRRIIS